MTVVHELSIALTEELAGEVEAAVASGDYVTTSEVVRDALRQWKRARADRDAIVGELRTAWGEGIASGDPRPVDPAAIKAAGRRALAA